MPLIPHQENGEDKVKVIIAGSRGFDDYNKLKYEVDKIIGNKKDVTILSGRARGADRLGERYAKERGIPVIYFPANWDKYGRSAGIIRNTEMAKHADVLIAFWDGESRGTKHMIQTAQKYGLKVHLFLVSCDTTRGGK